jgi:tetratricopeptide (TPR) repeat protein
VHYENAERALAEENWRLAVEQINQAIERRGDSGARVRSYGMRVVDYFPYLTLGIAYHQLGQYDAALEAFATEEGLGVVRASPEASDELERYRRRALEGRDAAAAAAVRRREQIVEQSLAEARRLEERGQLAEAMGALAPGLAVSPQHEGLVALMTGLRARVVARDESDREGRVVAERLEAARTHLARGEPEPAASLLRQVLASRPGQEARRLLDQAQQAIVASVAAERRSAQIEEALAAAARLGETGRFAAALERLEIVLALDPGHAEAASLNSRLLAAAAAARQAVALQDAMQAAGADLAAGRVEAALATANRVLAVDRGHAGALEVVRRAYAEISRRLRLEAAPVNFPPAIRFADQRQERAGELVELVRDPDFQLDGVAIDSSPVRIALFDAASRELEATSTSQAVGEYFVTQFRTRCRLRAGRIALTVVATDAAGLSSRGEYTVVYDRPWFRSPWSYAASAAIPGLGLLALVAHRSRRRRLLRRRRFNPYIAGGPVFAEELFYGREPLIQRILQTIHTNSLMLHGERRIGKTSLLHQLRRRLETLDDPEYRFHAAYIDLQGTPEQKLFATLADQIFDALGGVVGAQAREPALARPAGYDHHDLVRELYGLLDLLQQRSRERVRLVLLIDEVDELNRYDPRVNQKLRSVFMKRFAESVVAVVAGVRIRKEWEEEGSPWYNFFEEIEVEAIAPEAARELVLRPLRGVFRVERGVAERIAASSQGRPYLIQRRCRDLVSRLHEEGRQTITLADVIAAERLEAG